jgi:hypothetical protein
VNTAIWDAIRAEYICTIGVAVIFSRNTLNAVPDATAGGAAADDDDDDDDDDALEAIIGHVC